jgi:hypothetical protein
MRDPDVIYADPWLNKAKRTMRLPDSALFMCAYEVDLVVDFFYQASFLRRTETVDELWIGYGEPLTNKGLGYGIASEEDFEAPALSSIGCRFAVVRKGEELTACLRLLELWFRAVYGFEFIEAFVAPGIVNKSSYDSLVRRLEDEHEQNRQKARERETEIIRVARELGLSPQPTGTGPTHWQIGCLRGRNHPAYIDSALNYFFCGWCGYKGGVEELRAFAKRRHH